MRKRCQVKISVPIDPMLAKPATSSIDILSSVPLDGNIDAKVIFYASGNTME